MVEVGFDLLAAQRLDPVPHSDALIELSQFPAANGLFQRVLSHENQLQTLFLGGGEIQKQPQTLEGIRIEVLRLVDDEEHLAPLPPSLLQHTFQVLQKIRRIRLPGDRLPQFEQDVLEEFREGQPRHVDEHRLENSLDLHEQTVDGQGLARADAAGDEDDVFSLLDPVDQVRHGLAERAAGIDEDQLRRQRKRIGVHTEMLLIHAGSPGSGMAEQPS